MACRLWVIYVRWGKIMIPTYRLWLHSLYGPRCLLSPERPLNLITHSLNCILIPPTSMLVPKFENQTFFLDSRHKKRPFSTQIVDFWGTIKHALLSKTWFFSNARLSYLHNGISYTGKMSSEYWIEAQKIYSFSNFLLISLAYPCNGCQSVNVMSK